MLKVLAPDDPEGTDCLIRVLDHLAEQGSHLPVPRLLPTSSGEALGKVTRNGVVHATCVMSYLPGRLLAEVYPDVPDSGRARLLEDLDPAKAHWVRGRIAQKKKDLTTAEKEFRAAIDASKGGALAWFNLALFYRKNQQWDQMEQTIIKAAAAPMDRPEIIMEAGDVLLRAGRTLAEVGAILAEAVRESDILARYGGDEFVVVLPETPPPGALVIAERLRRAIEVHSFLQGQGLTARISASFGISSYPDHALTPEGLIQKADQAMYRVKERDKNGIEVAV